MADAPEAKTEVVDTEIQQNGKSEAAASAGAQEENKADVKGLSEEDDKEESKEAIKAESKEDIVKAESKDDVVRTEADEDTTPEKRKEAPESTEDDQQDHKRPRGDRPFFKKTTQIQSRFEDQPESNDADDIRRQVEFYFSDSNLPIDAYLLGRTGGHKNFPVALKDIHNFKRMRHFQPYSAVRDAVKASTFLDLDDQDQITRKVPLDAKFTNDFMKNRTLVHTGNMSRSIYAKGFGEEKKSTHLDIEAFFTPYGPLNSVRLRRDGRGAFKGSVFVEFENEALQQQFLELETKPQWDGKDLQIMGKQAYVDTKHDGILEGVVKPRSPMRHNPRGKDRRSDDWGKRGNKDHRGSKDRFDKDDWKSRRDRDQEEDRRGRSGQRGRGHRPHRSGRGGRGGRHEDDRRRKDSDASVDGDESPAQGKKRNLEDESEAQGGAKKMKAENGSTAPGTEHKSAGDEKPAVAEESKE